MVRVSMSLSFDNPESFKEAAESLRFNNSPSDPSTSSTPSEESSEAMIFNYLQLEYYNMRLRAADESEDPTIPTISNTN